MTGPRTVRRADVDLFTWAAVCGYRGAAGLGRALEHAGTPVPQPVLSRMLRGEQVYPKARNAVAGLLGLELEELDGLVERGAA